MQHLAGGVISMIAEYLGGVSGLMLSHVNRRLYILLSRVRVWTPRVQDSIKGESDQLLAMPRSLAKRVYVQTHHALLSRPLDRPMIYRSFGRDRDQTIAIRFCLLPQYIPEWKPGESIDIFCSSNQQLTVRVPPGQWCELAWVLSTRDEIVYFNGNRLAANRRSSRTHCYLWDGEFRTNFFGRLSKFPNLERFDMCDFVFHGLVDDFRVWERQHISIQGFTRGEPCDHSVKGENCFVTTQQLTEDWVPWVLCTQPNENIGEIMPISNTKPRLQREAQRPDKDHGFTHTRRRRWWPWRWSWRLCQ